MTNGPLTPTTVLYARKINNKNFEISYLFFFLLNRGCLI